MSFMLSVALNSRMLNALMLIVCLVSVVMLIVTIEFDMLSVIMLSAAMLRVEAFVECLMVLTFRELDQAFFESCQSV
jgi:hypothetical protein